ncbi:MAG: type VI secretion system ATPase TssH, partial [Firmicutes bacterium]|nr:type VI secretion system ATPase TssH [Bacillota bacterium]MBQ1523628.1 type VI secretion system ATPase TssH [Bacillota bacterium]
MNANKLTQKSMEAISTAQNIAVENGNMQIEAEHLLYALLDQDGGLIPSLLERSGVDVNRLIAAVNTRIENMPRVSGPGREEGKVYISPETDRILTAAEKTAEHMKDDYVSVEHIFIAILEKGDRETSKILADAGVTKESFLTALAAVKSGRVTGDNPEETYDALNKYGSDLVERARKQQLDPVIGRDDE